MNFATSKLAIVFALWASTACAQVVLNPRIHGTGNTVTLAPTTPITGPSPATAATGVAITGSLTWSGCTNATSWNVLGPDTTNPPTTFHVLAGNSYNFGTLDNNVTYYWKPTCSNATNSVTTALVLSFTTIAGPVPGTPSNPSPSDTATGISTSVTLSCSSSDVPTSWAILGPSTSSTLSGATNHTGLTTCSLPISGLTNSATYYWKATATNGSGSTAGAIWSFTIVAGGGISTITAGDITWLGQKRVSSNGNCWSGNGAIGNLAVRYVAGVRHILISQSIDLGQGNLTPCEFSDPATFDSNGDCTSNCPTTTLATSPQLPFIGNWGYLKAGITSVLNVSDISVANPTVITTATSHGLTTGQHVVLSGSVATTPNIKNTYVATVTGATTFTVPVNVTVGQSSIPANTVYAQGVYDFFHGVLGTCYGNAGGTCNDLGTTVYNDCAIYGGGGCQLTSMFIVPGTPDRLYFTFGALYGPYHQWNLGFCELTTTPVKGVTDPVSTCYGPFNSETPLRQAPTQTSADNYKGLRSARYLMKLPDATYGWGGDGSGASFQQGFGPAGPTLVGGLTLPTSASVSGPSGANILASTKYLGYYNMACSNPPSCTVPQLNLDGSVPGGNAIWAFRFPGYSYLWSGIPCSVNSDNPVPPNGCPGLTYVDDADKMQIDPRQNSGIGTWGDTFTLSGGAWPTLTTRQGIIFFGAGTLNLSVGNITTCSHAIAWYCSGQSKGNSGSTCAGGADGGYGHPGDFKDPKYQCSCVACATGPSSNQRIPFILVFNPDDATSVAAGTKTDYTVEAASIINPLTDISSSIHFAPSNFIGIGSGWGGVAMDPNNSHIIIVTTPQADGTTAPGYNDIIINYFKIAG